MSTRGPAGEAGAATVKAVRWAGGVVRGQVVSAVGGPARARVIMLFACVLALNSADTSTIGAVAPQLEQSLHIHNVEIGLLSSVTLLVGAAFVIPFGLFVDRSKRVPMLSASIVLWSLASLFSAVAPSYTTLLLTRLLMGAVTATAGPAIASLTGDYFPSRERGRIYAYILGGEIAGTAIGFTFSGLAASIISWRAAFVLIALPGFFLARELWVTVPEPSRGGQNRLQPGVENLQTAVAAGQDPDWTWEDEHGGEAEELAHHAVRARGVEPDPKLVLRVDPKRMGLVAATRYILSIPTNVLLIGSSALGYFFFAGLTTFLVTFVRDHYHQSTAATTLILLALVIASVIGTLISGRVTDAMVRRGKVEARVIVPAVCYMGATVLFIPGVLSNSLTPALWFDLGGAALLAAANPPLDAARLDIMPAALWGRAESTRTLVRSLAQAISPVLFGGLADLIAGIAPKQAPIGTHISLRDASTGTGLEYTFLVMLVSLGAAGWFMLRARHTYARDIAAAAASQEVAAQARSASARRS